MTSQPFQRKAHLSALLAFGLGVSACGEGFDSPAEVKTLRVLGLQKDAPYPAPGQTVNFSLLFHDPENRDVKVYFSEPCANPPGDLYRACLPQLATRMVVEGSAQVALTIPSDVITSRTAPNPGQPKYGLSYVFFAVCAGDRVELDSSQAGAISASSTVNVPLQCVDAAGKRLGPDSFIVGYTALYSFDDIQNANPAVTGFQLNGAELGSDCIDADCLPGGEQLPVDEVDCDDSANAERCFDACEDDGDSSCPGIDVQPLIDPSSAERDEASIRYFGRDVGEQQWVNYYADRGGLKSPARLLNDAITGWNDSFGTEYYAPKDPGTVTLWAVAHDNRGGASWTRVRLGIR